MENGLKSDIVVTDLDGNIKTLKKAGKTNYNNGCTCTWR